MPTPAEELTELRRLEEKQLPERIADKKTEVDTLTQAVQYWEKLAKAGGDPKAIGNLVDCKRELEAAERQLSDLNSKADAKRKKEIGEDRFQLEKLEADIPKLIEKRDHLRKKLGIADEP